MVNDNSWLTSFDLADNTVTIINPDDVDPLSSKKKDSFTKYMHSGVSVSGDILAIGLVFRNVVGEASYCDTTHRMLNTNIHTTYDYAYLHNEFDGDIFHSHLCTKFNIHVRFLYLFF